jgi:hypothetical protein
MIMACRILEVNINRLSKEQLLNLVGLVILIQDENYATHHKRTKEELMKILGL